MLLLTLSHPSQHVITTELARKWHEDDLWVPTPYFPTRSLEADVELGDDYEKNHAREFNVPFEHRCKISRLPFAICHDLLHLRHKHKNLRSLAAACRYVSRCGAHLLQKVEAIREVRKLQEAFYKRDDMQALAALTGQRYEFSISPSSREPVYVHVFRDALGTISNLAHDAGLERTTDMVVLTLVAGLAQSEHWIPSSHTRRYTTLVCDFTIWCQSRVEYFMRLLNY